MSGEVELIELLRERLAAAGVPAGERVMVGSGDDASVVRAEGAQAVSVDALVDGVHFRRGTFPPAAIGAKAIAAALSDLAAMGARPGEAYVQLGLPEDLGETEMLGIADGLGAGAARAGCAVAGGDVVRSPVLFLALTVVGYAETPERLLERSGAVPGDVLLVTGELGGAAAGLLLLERPELGAGLEPGIAEALRARQLEPTPRLAAGAVLAAAGASAMIDVSDGLAADAGHLALASGVPIEVDAESVPAQAGALLLATAAGEEGLTLVLGGGEDYELLATVPPERLEAAREAVGAHGLDSTVVGRVEAGEGLVLRGPSGSALDVRGFDHLRLRARVAPT